MIQLRRSDRVIHINPEYILFMKHYKSQFDVNGVEIYKASTNITFLGGVTLEVDETPEDVVQLWKYDTLGGD